MFFNRPNINKWIFALLLALPVFYLYSLHFFYHDAGIKPTGLIQWEHAVYMISAKEYQAGNALIFYQYPLDDNWSSPTVFFQPHIFLLGYLWKIFGTEPGIILSLFGLFFSVLTCRMIIAILDEILPAATSKKLIAVLFTWGGGILAICGAMFHIVFFKNEGSLNDHLFFLDPGDGWWCLSFGRSLIYPLEAYYHCMFMYAILLLLRRQFAGVAVVMFLLTISHPYTSTELIAIVATWMVIDYFYLRSKEVSKKGLWLILAAVLFHFFYYAVLVNFIPVYKTISQHAALDWGYKAWHFVPAYFIVWLLSFVAVKNVAFLKKQFASANNRLFFCWGMVAFLLSIHGFAIKPVQPIHFTRGYVYAGFFLFAIPAIILLINYVKTKNTLLVNGIFILSIVVFLSDNILWFGVNNFYKNSGVCISTDEQGLVNFFKNKTEKAWLLGPANREDLSCYIQLQSPYKAWIPHPYLTFNMEQKKGALQRLIDSNIVDEHWRKAPTYLYTQQKDTLIKPLNFPVRFENKTFKVFQIN